jgi:hypothetical protein
MYIGKKQLSFLFVNTALRKTFAITKKERQNECSHRSSGGDG